MYLMKVDNNSRCKYGNFKVGKRYICKDPSLVYCIYKDLDAIVEAHDVDEDIDNFWEVEDPIYEVEPLNKVISIKYGRFITNKIKVVKKLNIDELIDLDVIGRWCFKSIIYRDNDSNIEKLVNSLIEKDKTGRLCYYAGCEADLSEDIIRRLYNVVVERDSTGELIRCFNLNVKEGVLINDN